MVLRSLPDADAFGVVPIGAEGRGAGGADPFAAALVPALLFGQTLRQLLGGRMYPLTLEGLDKAMRELVR